MSPRRLDVLDRGVDHRHAPGYHGRLQRRRQLPEQRLGGLLADRRPDQWCRDRDRVAQPQRLRPVGDVHGHRHRAAPSTGTPTGTVTFFDGVQLLGDGTLTGPGVWTFSTAALTAGTHPDITADYSGDANFPNSDSADFSQTVDKASSTTTVTSSPTPSVVGQSVTFTAVVAAVAPGAGRDRERHVL